MVVGAIHTKHNTKLEGDRGREAEHENILSARKGLQERRVSFDVYEL